MQEATGGGLKGDLEFVCRQISVGERLFDRQRAQIAQMRAEGRDSTDAENALAKLEETLTLMRGLQHRLVGQDQ